MCYGKFAYSVGELVELHAQPSYYLIRWRALLLLGSPSQRYRQAVYWLGPPFWDCHYEDELVMLGRR